MSHAKRWGNGRTFVEEPERLKVLARVKRGGAEAEGATELLELIYRQCRPLYKRCQDQVHGNRGQPSTTITRRSLNRSWRSMVTSPHDETLRGWLRKAASGESYVSALSITNLLQFSPNIDTITLEIASEKAGFVVMFAQTGDTSVSEADWQ